MNKPDSMNPIFFHSMWRTSSTYFYSLFRNDSAYLAFYEPFNEALVSLNTALAQPEEPSHPTFGKPLFDEYRHVSSGEQIESYDVNFAYIQKLWFDFDSQCKTYIDRLIHAAQAEKRTPFLQFNRSFLCLDHFATCHDRGLNVYFYRNPRDQFESFDRAGRAYYLGLSFLQYAAETSRNPSSVLRHFNVPFYYSLNSFQNTLAFYRAFTELSLVTCYYVFFSLWCLGLLNALRLDFPVVDTLPAARTDDRVSSAQDFFAARFPDIKLGDYRPTVYTQNAENASAMAGVESLLLTQLENSHYRDDLPALRQLLSRYHPESQPGAQEQLHLAGRISEDLRQATNANFAAVGGGLRLGQP